MRGLIGEIRALPAVELFGRVASVQGLLIEVTGPLEAMSVGTRLSIENGLHGAVSAEVVGFRGDRALALPFGPLEGVRMGGQARIVHTIPAVRPSETWLGRVVNALGEPIDGKGPLLPGPSIYPLRNAPPPAHARSRLGKVIDLGVRTMNTFVSCCKGQRMGIFSGSGVGKSVLLSMLARNAASDVSIIGLVGERGREVQEFIEDDLGPEGMARSIVVVATSDEAALMRRQAAYLTLTLAEYFRDLGQDVLCLIDSVTRFAMAQREIGLASGEPPTSKGYTPTVFNELPRLLERAGPGTGQGSITGLFTVLVEGDDHNEPVADAVRGILDGHIVMERSIAERGRFPAINVLKSVSRTMPGCLSPDEAGLIIRARKLMAAYADMEELIQLGAYRPGSNPETDKAIAHHPRFEAFLRQDKAEATSREVSFELLAQLLNDDALEMPANQSVSVEGAQS